MAHILILPRLFLHTPVLRKRFRLPLAAAYPLPELLLAHLRDCPQTLPARSVILQVGITRLLHAAEAVHHLVFVKLSRLGVALVYHIHVAALRVVAQKHIYVVAVHTLSAAHVAVRVVHHILPPLAVSVRAAAHAPFRVLYRHVQTVNPHMAFPVVSRFFLRFARIPLHLAFRTPDVFIGIALQGISTAFPLLKIFNTLHFRAVSFSEP